jgi:NADPH:quinone reductase-like Zn-dependent oxidoreductase
MRVFEVTKGSTSLDGLRVAERPKPAPAAGEVLMRVRAVSLNFRDLAIVTGKYFAGSVRRDTIPLSDGAGEIEAVGDGVTRVAVGDRIAATFTQPPEGLALGSPLDGVLSEHAVLHEAGVVPIPDTLSFEEAATLPCAGVTAWNALTQGRRLKPGDTVLTLGTGGVSMFALQLAKAAGARVIVTSSSDGKLERARALGADETVNYKSTPDWAEAVRALTAGAGADHVIELGGAGTLPQSYEAVGPRGEISLIGVLVPPDGDLSPHPLMRKGATLRGIFVGGRPLLEGLLRAIEVNGIRPVINKAFDFEESPEAYAYLKQAQHVGKIVIRLAD